MSMFRRRRRDEAEPDQRELQDDVLDPEEYDDAAEAGGERLPSRTSGPWDLAEVDDPGSSGRIDLGGMWIPGTEGLEVRVEADQSTGQIMAVTLVLDEDALQLQPFAAPRTEGIWDEIRAEIRSGVTASGGTVDEVEGPMGTELRTQVPVRAQDGRTGVQPARFLGVDGPRWFLRGVITGRAAIESGADEALLALYRDVVVVRGSEPMAPREPIPLALPVDATGDEEQPPTRETLNPFARGPEITEIH